MFPSSHSTMICSKLPLPTVHLASSHSNTWHSRNTRQLGVSPRGFGKPMRPRHHAQPPTRCQWSDWRGAVSRCSRWGELSLSYNYQSRADTFYSAVLLACIARKPRPTGCTKLQSQSCRRKPWSSSLRAYPSCTAHHKATRPHKFHRTASRRKHELARRARDGQQDNGRSGVRAYLDLAACNIPVCWAAA